MAKDEKHKSDLIDDDINFDDRKMHRMGPMIRGCALLIGMVVVFTFITMYVFKHYFNAPPTEKTPVKTPVKR